MIEKSELHKLLIELKKKITNSKKWYAFLLPESKKNYVKIAGICTNIAKLTDYDVDVATASESLKEYYSSWEYYSGDPVYPVPNVRWPDPVREYHAYKNLWDYDTAYGMLRYNLLDHLIEATKD